MGAAFDSFSEVKGITPIGDSLCVCMCVYVKLGRKQGNSRSNFILGMWIRLQSFL